MKSDPSTCPRCQSQNGCAILQGKSIELCWCHTQAFPSKTVLANAISAGGASYLLENKSCLCQACIKALKLEEKNRQYKRVD
ncbi:cysteine-rich CWC family protein [Shewanella sp. KX20019]|uniref:cysteine-rich CWC family protein n=1 Tax=Shewanella sp. KX20019 TaxID=2803864 RepID=UPI001928A4DB|nr:cysteine-rich CWC family protein [Shewanella sp. KX20019]QQX80775.1 cysteine-rich CWC family protein [Shewanella sp. KX20019]